MQQAEGRTFLRGKKNKYPCEPHDVWVDTRVENKAGKNVLNTSSAKNIIIIIIIAAEEKNENPAANGFPIWVRPHFSRRDLSNSFFPPRRLLLFLSLSSCATVKTD